VKDALYITSFVVLGTLAVTRTFGRIVEPWR